MKITYRSSALAIGLFGLLVLLTASFSYAQAPEEIQQEIEGHNIQIAELNKEIAAYEKQLTEVGAKKQTLQNTLSALDLSRKKVTAQISLTKNKIGALQLEIQELSRGIAGKESSIEKDEAGLAESVRHLNETESQTLLEAMLSSKSMSDVWQDMEASVLIQVSIKKDIDALAAQKKTLSETKTSTEAKRAELLKQQKNLVAQQGSLDATRKAQNDLLAQTKSQESTFQAILRDKQAAKASFEQALQDLQSKLQYTVDPSQIPPAGKGILRWPLDTVYVTQKFGNTDFARAGGYNGKGHNGIDFRAPVGTAIKSALTGTVVGTGNTDSVRGCYSYGKWILVKHANGLDTLYAHLSQSNVVTGQSVATGQVIGYSGATGYATGPHLHFGVYAASSVQIIKLGDATNKKTPCSDATMPIAPLTGYLNPLEYL